MRVAVLLSGLVVVVAVTGVVADVVVVLTTGLSGALNTSRGAISFFTLVSFFTSEV